ncbi:MAG: hypothetical protein JWM19_3773, partial [Actinomycetia bacterium]|nr:hypothetical protein [Actinomycetes bacterium]
MSLHLSPKTVIFDYGDVISLPQSPGDRAIIERLAGVNAERFWAS